MVVRRELKCGRENAEYVLGTWVFSKQAELMCVRVGHVCVSLALGVCLGVCVEGGSPAPTLPHSVPCLPCLLRPLADYTAVC